MHDVECCTCCCTSSAVPHATVKLIQRPDKLRADGTAPVYVRITANRKTRQKATGVYVEPKHWNAKRQEVRASHDIADALNSKLRDTLNEARTLALNAPTAKAVQSRIGGVGGSLTSYFQRFIDRLDSRDGFWEWKKYRVTLGKLQECLGREIAWREVDRDALIRFERYCREKKKNNPNTTRKELTRLRRVYKEAIRDGVIAASDDPFLTYQKPKGQKVERRKLTPEEIGKIEALTSADGLTPGTFDELTRDAFIFSYYAAGMRFSDVAQLKAVDVSEGRVQYRMLKTGTPVSVPLPPAALAIVHRYSPSAQSRGGYLFPLLEGGDERDAVHLRRRIGSRNAQVNTALKRVAEKAGIKPEGLSFHVSRHSFADYARRQGGDLYAISKALGHSKLQTTEAYLSSFDQDAVDKLSAQLWT